MELRLDRAQDLAGLGGDGVGTVGRHLVAAQIDQRFPQHLLQRAGLKRGDERNGPALRLPNECATAFC